MLPRIFAVCGLLLVPWIGVLSQYGAVGNRGLDSAWVGLDVLEAICLLATAGLASRRQPATSPVAAATAAIFCMDAWFDTMSAAPRLPYAESLAMACLAELPLAALLAWTSWRALGWAARPPECQERKAVAVAADLFNGTDSVAALGVVGLRGGLRGVDGWTGELAAGDPQRALEIMTGRETLL